MPAAWGIIAAGLISGLGSLIGGGIGADAASSASDAQAAAAIQAAQIQATASLGAAGIQGQAATTAASTESDAALQAARLQSRSAMQAAGLETGSAVTAAQIQAGAAEQASNNTLSMFNTTQGNLRPYMDAGTAGLQGQLTLAGSSPPPITTAGTVAQTPQWQGGAMPYFQGKAPTLDLPSNLTQPFAPTMAQLEQTPGYQFTLQQGLQAAQNGSAAQGLGRSGAAVKGAVNYAEGLAGTTFQQQFGDYMAQNAQTAGILTNQYNSNLAGFNSDVGAYGANVGAFGTNLNAYTAQLGGYQTQLAAEQQAFGQSLGSEQNEFNQLGALASGGLTAAQGYGNLGASYQSQINQLQMGAANYGANAIMTGAQAAAGGLTGSANAQAQGITNAAMAGAQGLIGSANAGATGLLNSANASASGYLGAGQAAAAGSIGVANALGGAIGGVSSSAANTATLMALANGGFFGKNNSANPLTFSGGSGGTDGQVSFSQG